ncbi:MAG: hypothetical protein AB7P04_15855, partial [Bacteriovoracia bacterium]
ISLISIILQARQHSLASGAQRKTAIFGAHVTGSQRFNTSTACPEEAKNTPKTRKIKRGKTRKESEKKTMTGSKANARIFLSEGTFAFHTVLVNLF